jgi:hypothetical protein
LVSSDNIRGELILKKHNINISSIDHKIEYNSITEIATITPTIHVTCTKSQILIASIHVDDHELRPSLKLIFETGERSYEVPYVKIARPLISSPDDNSKDKEYKITLKLHFSEDEVHDLDEYIKITKS